MDDRGMDIDGLSIAVCPVMPPPGMGRHFIPGPPCGPYCPMLLFEIVHFQFINRFNTENRPFYIVDHDSGEYSLCLAFSFLDGEYKEFGQDAFNRYALEINEPVVDGRGMFTHGSGYEWQAVFEKAFEGDPNSGRIRSGPPCGPYCPMLLFEIVHFQFIAFPAAAPGYVKSC